MLNLLSPDIFNICTDMIIQITGKMGKEGGALIGGGALIVKEPI